MPLVGRVLGGEQVELRREECGGDLSGLVDLEGPGESDLEEPPEEVGNGGQV